MTNQGPSLPDPAPGTRIPARHHGVYGITIAAELSGAPTQSLRLWERHGLLSPARTEGGTRRYSADDLARIERIVTLVAAGVNIAGIGRILDLEDINTGLRSAAGDTPPHARTRTDSNATAHTNTTGPHE
ncbi:MerR family transcriptional regulator [[Mycobacterium] nativiensis]|uniref:MerR family transcriptional regulator n=1 Tax=[Mycobacterium] nativiensis TaxID=2855503 RepID=A0ABU5XX36_9MYCO|nr:MerR family transcriptional regulator [Mycolicibacter sp. MYC340]MEB3032337.1 MerR family transcriptional regulator [Mycolicibacter sp. MYC340]